MSASREAGNSDHGRQYRDLLVRDRRRDVGQPDVYGAGAPPAVGERLEGARRVADGRLGERLTEDLEVLGPDSGRLNAVLGHHRGEAGEVFRGPSDRRPRMAFQAWSAARYCERSQ